MILENWGVVAFDPYQAPEIQQQSLQGNVYHSSKFPDGHSIVTSPIIGKRNDTVITLSGSEYHLGKVSDEYEKLYPDARTRLFDSLPEVEEDITEPFRSMFE